MLLLPVHCETWRLSLAAGSLFLVPYVGPRSVLALLFSVLLSNLLLKLMLMLILILYPLRVVLLLPSVPPSFRLHPPVVPRLQQFKTSNRQIYTSPVLMHWSLKAFTSTYLSSNTFQPIAAVTRRLPFLSLPPTRHPTNQVPVLWVLFMCNKRWEHDSGCYHAYNPVRNGV